MTVGMYCPNCPCERCRTIQALEAMGDLVYHVPDQQGKFGLSWLCDEWRRHLAKEWTMVQADWNHYFSLLAPHDRYVEPDERGRFLLFGETKIRPR